MAGVIGGCHTLLSVCRNPRTQAMIGRCVNRPVQHDKMGRGLGEGARPPNSAPNLIPYNGPGGITRALAGRTAVQGITARRCIGICRGLAVPRRLVHGGESTPPDLSGKLTNRTKKKKGALVFVNASFIMESVKFVIWLSPDNVQAKRRRCRSVFVSSFRKPVCRALKTE